MSNTGKRTLILVDDEDNIRRALIRVLRRDGYNILNANGGQQGLELLQANPDTGVILSDQRMPHMTGIEFLSRARQLRPDTVRIVLSGYTDLKTVTEAINQGEIYKFLTKPWDDDLLRSNVNEAFEHYELIFENQRLTRELLQINADLERRVEQKAHESLMNGYSLQIIQDVLEHLPVGVLGFDNDGLLVVSNQSANAQLSEAGFCPVGQFANQILTGNLLQQTELALRGDTPAPFNVDLGVSKLFVHCGRLGATSKAQGVVVVMVPRER